MFLRISILLVFACVAFVPAAQTAPTPDRSAAPAARSAVLASPAGLHAFLLRADERSLTSFSRTPSFAWSPYYGATSYQFHLATSTAFDARPLVSAAGSRSTALNAPATTITVALPWMTGHPYALYARTRAVTRQ